MRFLRHDGIYRSDVSSLLINPVQMPPPVGRPRYQAIGRAGRNYTSFPSSAMSLGLGIPWQVALQQSLPPLHRPESILHPPAETVNHHLTGAGEFSTGEMGNFQPALTLERSRGKPPMRNCSNSGNPVRWRSRAKPGCKSGKV